MKMVDRLAWLAWSVGLVLAIGGYWLLYLDRDTVGDAFDLMTPVSGLAFCTVGLLIVRARPGNRVGWLASVLGFVLVISFFCSEYAIRGLLGNGLLAGRDGLTSRNASGTPRLYSWGGKGDVG